MELKITKEKVLEAASKCSTAKETLKTLFPEVFEEDKEFIDLSKLELERASHLKSNIYTGESCQAASKCRDIIQIRTHGEYANKGFYLRKSFDWKIETDSHGALVLIPRKKS